jgi:flagellar hook-associated protein 3 FlgL
MANYSTTPASAAQTAIDSAFSTYFGFSPTDAAAANVPASSMQSFLSSSAFTDLFQGASWSGASATPGIPATPGIWSSASSANISSEIAPGETIETSTNANQPSFQQLTQAYAMLTEFGGSQLSNAAQQVVATTASSLVSSALTSLTATEANVGSTQDLITDANNSMSAQMTTLQTQIGNLDNVNSYTVATEVNSLTTQIQTAYELTAKIQQLSLAQYLPIT